jgi:phage repressor protein C with HTH and peptisase S24 domain
MSFWSRFEEALSENKITASELSRNIGIASSVIYAWKMRDSIPRADVAVKVAEQLNTTVEYLINGTNPEFINQKRKNSFLVPILNQELSAGKGEILPEDDFVKGLIELPSFLREYGQNIAGLYVHGDSMEPTLKNGDLVICNSLGWDNEEGLYAIRFNGNGYVKRIQVGAGKIIICSDNPKYKPIEESVESDNFEIIGKVLLILKKSA